MSLQPFRTNIKQLVGALTTYFYRRGGGEHGLYAFHPLTTPLTSTSWDGDAKTTGDNGTIDLSTVFSAPAGIKAALVRLTVRDETINVAATLRQSSGGASMVIARTQVANQYIDETAVAPCDTNGDFYFQTSDELDNVIIQIWGYWL